MQTGLSGLRDRLAAYYVATEALANVAKHSNAAGARLELCTAAGELLSC